MIRKLSEYNLSWLGALVILSIITLVMFGDVLFVHQDIVLSREGTDLSDQFMYWRDFGFKSLREGHLPLWNPYICSGVPFLGNFQSALLYPLNFPYLILPLPQAINWGIAIHVLLTGFFMFLWTSHRGLQFFACLLSSVLLMFSGAHFMHLYAGHLSNLCAMTWPPLVFLAVDGLLKRFSLPWCLLGIFAVAMQILAGHPQYVYYTAIAVFIYSALHIAGSKDRLLPVLGLAVIYAGGAAVCAVQLSAGIQAAVDSARGASISYNFVSMFSFPPENALTLLTPWFFGNMKTLPYWGRCFLWEMMLFFSITGLVLAIHGSFRGERSKRRFSVTMVIVLMILALGAHTPLLNVLYSLMPGFDKFRGVSKFIFPATLFFTLLAGIGLDDLLRRERPYAKISLMVFIMGVLLAAAAALLYGAILYPSLTDAWRYVMQGISATRESYLNPLYYSDAAFMNRAVIFSLKNLLFSSGVLFILSCLLYLSKYSRKLIYVVAALAVLEIFTFAMDVRPTYNFQSKIKMAKAKFYALHPGDYRSLNFENHNFAMSMGIKEIWGYDPAINRRYAEFMAFTQGKNPDDIARYIPPNHFHPLYYMLRCRYVVDERPGGLFITELPDVMPHLKLISDWQVFTSRDAIFKEMTNKDFDPRRTVILEKTPEPKPANTRIAGNCEIVDSSTDSITIRAELPSAAILLITDSYSSGWKASSLSGSVQANYEIMPANYILMAIPLSAGDHHIRLEYNPMAFYVCLWISIISVITYVVLLFLALKKACKNNNPPLIKGA